MGRKWIHLNRAEHGHVLPSTRVADDCGSSNTSFKEGYHLNTIKEALVTQQEQEHRASGLQQRMALGLSAFKRFRYHRSIPSKVESGDWRPV